jgi:hypothetical protein
MRHGECVRFEKILENKLWLSKAPGEIFLRILHRDSKKVRQHYFMCKKYTHSVFVTRIQYVNCVLLGNYATFHNNKMSKKYVKRKMNLSV